VFAPATLVASVADGLVDALDGVQAGWLLAAVCLHVSAQVMRGIAWRGVLQASWPAITRRRACAWYVCGAGLSGVLSGRGAELVRIALAKRELPGATWPALAGTAIAECSCEALLGLVLSLVALAIGVDALHPPSAALVAAVGGIAVLIGVLAARSERVRGAVREVGRGASALRDPPRLLGRILPWQVAGKLLRLAAVACFLHAFGLPAAIVVVIAVCVLYGSGNFLPIPGAGTAAGAAALLVGIPAVTGEAVDSGAVTALVIVQPAVLTITGVTLSVLLLSVLLGARTPRALVRAGRSLAPQPSAAG
jgi:uncharacterized membrane protein YbhN (UPF0104 family)